MAWIADRNGVYYLFWREGKRKRMRSLRTGSVQIAKQKLRQFESAQFQGDPCPLPTKTPIGELLSEYIDNMRTHKTYRSVRVDVFYLRETFGPVCTELAQHSRRNKEARNRIDVGHLEQVSTEDVSRFLSTQVQDKLSLEPALN